MGSRGLHHVAASGRRCGGRAPGWARLGGGGTGWCGPRRGLAARRHDRRPRKCRHRRRVIPYRRPRPDPSHETTVDNDWIWQAREEHARPYVAGTRASRTDPTSWRSNLGSNRRNPLRARYPPVRGDRRRRGKRLQSWNALSEGPRTAVEKAQPPAGTCGPHETSRTSPQPSPADGRGRTASGGRPFVTGHAPDRQRGPQSSGPGGVRVAPPGSGRGGVSAGPHRGGWRERSLPGGVQACTAVCGGRQGLSEDAAPTAQPFVSPATDRSFSRAGTTRSA